jgi:hypothetical protein
LGEKVVKPQTCKPNSAVTNAPRRKRAGHFLEISMDSPGSSALIRLGRDREGEDRGDSRELRKVVRRQEPVQSMEIFLSDRKAVSDYSSGSSRVLGTHHSGQWCDVDIS